MLPRAETLRIQDSVCIYQAQKHQRKGKATQLDTRAVRTGKQEQGFVQGLSVPGRDPKVHRLSSPPLALRMQTGRPLLTCKG